MRHVWEPVQDGVFRVHKRFRCENCGTETVDNRKGFQILHPDAVARVNSILDDCQEQTVRNVLET